MNAWGKCAFLALALCSVWNPATASSLPEGKAAAIIDLATEEGVQSVSGTWRYADVRIIEAPFFLPGSNGQPTGRPTVTYDYEPHAGGVKFDDANWSVVAPADLQIRRGHGRLSFAWYRITVTVPHQAGGVDLPGMTAVLDTAVDDYAEVWVDGELSRALGQSGGSVVAGWNASNRLVIGRNLKPGQRIQIAVFAMNGPISGRPTNYVWMRHARLEFFTAQPGPVALTPSEVNLEVKRFAPELDAIVPANPKLFKLAEGFGFTEGPVWASGGYLLFSDPNENRIYRFDDNGSAAGRLTVFRDHSGYDGSDIAEYGQPGSNGLAFDPTGRLTVAQHGHRRIIRLDASGNFSAVADRFDGKRLNSPNDLVYRSDGSLYFTDPPFGLPKFFDDRRKELAFSGVFRVSAGGQITKLTDELAGPNGIAFSPDERYLYVGNWDPKRKVVMRYPVRIDGGIGGGETFLDLTGVAADEAIDGLKTDRLGNLYVSGPGGLWIVAPDGRKLGLIELPRLAANFAWGGPDGRTLYLTARSALYRMPLGIPGARLTKTN